MKRIKKQDSLITCLGWSHFIPKYLCRFKLKGQKSTHYAYCYEKKAGIVTHISSNLKLAWKHKGADIAKTILKKEINPGSLTNPDFKLYYKAVGIKIECYQHTNRHKINRTEMRAQK